MKLTNLVLIYFYKKGYSARKIAEKFKVSKKSVLNMGNKIGIKFINQFNNPNTIPVVYVKKLVRKGYSNKEISILLKSNVENIKTIKGRYNLKYIPKTKTKKVNCSFEKSVLIGTLLGDSSLDKNGRFSCTHSLKQKEYALYKHNILSKYITLCDPKENSRFDIRTNKTYFNITFNSKNVNVEIKNLRNEMYLPKKRITDSILKCYTKESLAFHYMDDGCKRGSSYSICTDSFDKESIICLIKHCEKHFGIRFYIDKRNRIVLSKKFNEQFKSLIFSHIHPTMMYKIH